MAFVVTYEGRDYELGTEGWMDAKTHLKPPSVISAKIERQVIEDNRQIERLREAHRLHVLGVGMPYLGTRAARPETHRKTHCYRCKRKLDNAHDEECRRCGWIICVCGACGCQYVEPDG